MELGPGPGLVKALTLAQRNKEGPNP